jgi:hypothetical protein
MKIRINRSFSRYKEGQIVNTDLLPKNELIYWRKLIRDSEVDGCVEIIVVDEKTTKTKKTNNNKKEEIENGTDSK